MAAGVLDASWVKASAMAAALYLTSGLAAAASLSRGVRNLLMAFEGTRLWAVGPRDALNGPAAEFAPALRRIAPGVKTIIVRHREEPEV